MTLRTIKFDDEQWQVVPKRPTMKQVTAGAEHSSSDDHMVARGQAAAIYDDMLKATPEPETCFCDEKGIGDPAKSCGDCPQDYGIPTVRANPEPPAQQRVKIPPGMPEYDALLDYIYEHGTAAEGVDRYAERLIEAFMPPAQQPAWLRVIDEALLMRDLGVLNQEDDYDTAKRKLGKLIEWEINVACDPAVGGDRVRKQQPPDDTQRLDHLIQSDAFRVFTADINGHHTWTGVDLPIGEGATVREAIDNSIQRHHGIGKGESNAG